MLDLLLIGGIIAGLLQFIGYVLYIKDEDIDPNPVTWFMFAYGTALLTVLEWDSNATFAELILPGVCSAMSIYVSYRCWQKARAKNPREWWPHDWWPSEWQDKVAFQTDIALTVGYLLAWTLLFMNVLNGGQKAVSVAFFLVASNLTTISSFLPLLRGTIKNPNTERATPWLVWAVAYAALIPVTLAAQGTFWHVLMLYPVLNTLMHGMVAWYARPSRRSTFLLRHLKLKYDSRN